MRTLRRLVPLVALIAFGGPAAAHAASAPAGFRPFAADSIWNLALRDDAPVEPGSSAEVAWLARQAQVNGTWLNTTGCGSPLYWADPGTPSVRVSVVGDPDAGLARAWAAVPIPAGAQPANCGDNNMSIAQVQSDGSIKSWEFWQMNDDNGTWSAHWGGAIDDLRTDTGIASTSSWKDPTQPWLTSRPWWNVTATSISTNAGVITHADLASGHIDHAISIAINDAAADRWMWPAQRTDGTSHDPDALPEGAHLRLPADLDLDALGLSPLMRMIAEAAQRYGLVVRDKTSGPDAFASEPDADADVQRILGSQHLWDVIGEFPWAQLRVLAAPTCTDPQGCSLDDRAVLDADTDAGAATTATDGQTVVFDTTNSELQPPRAQVVWDLDGDGAYETPGGTAVSRAVTMRGSGPWTIGVRITTVAGVTSFATRTIGVRPAVPPAGVATAGTAPAGKAPQAAVSAPKPDAAAESDPRLGDLPVLAPASTVSASAAAPAVAVRVNRVRFMDNNRRIRVALTCASAAVCKGRVQIRMAHVTRVGHHRIPGDAVLASGSFRVKAHSDSDALFIVPARIARLLSDDTQVTRFTSPIDAGTIRVALAS